MGTAVLGNGLMGSALSGRVSWDNFSRKSHGVEITIPDTYVRHIRNYSQVVNCIGFTKTNYNFKEPAWTVNYQGVITMVDICNQLGIKLIHMSTDYIYANSKENASEDDVPIHYDNWYTYTKVLADAYIQARCNRYLIIRASYKQRPYPWDNAWVNLKGNFDYVDVIADKIIRLVNNNASGIFNVGTEIKTMYDMARKTKPLVTISKDNVIPSDITMDLSKLNSFLK